MGRRSQFSGDRCYNRAANQDESGPYIGPFIGP